jgi:hypothetical protein
MPSVPDDVVYGIGRVDASGRIADRSVTGALGWSGGDRLTLTAEAGVITVAMPADDVGKHGGAFPGG